MKLTVLAALLLPASTTPPSAPSASALDRSAFPASSGSTMPNVFEQRTGCLPILQQVQDQARRDRTGDARTLDQEPPAALLLAVDRQVNGCREVTFVRRNVAPALEVPPGR
jgi:hypothetical protein